MSKSMLEKCRKQTLLPVFYEQDASQAHVRTAAVVLFVWFLLFGWLVFVSSYFYLAWLQLSHLNNFCTGFCSFAVSAPYVPVVPNRSHQDGDCLRTP